MTLKILITFAMMGISQNSFSYYRVIDQGCKTTYRYLKNEGIINQDNTVDDLKMLSEKQMKILKDENKSKKLEIDNEGLRITILNCDSINNKYWNDLDEDCLNPRVINRDESAYNDNLMRKLKSDADQQFSFKRKVLDSERIRNEKERNKNSTRIAEQKPVVGGSAPRPILTPKIQRLKTFNKCK